ncbi:MAG: zinc ABC transporter substrate-binding protein [Gammaproteobacteria bacterium]|nr:zinc ABC transporter substrate-binding protein [Gammaproteobacteria bacterium]
MTKQLYFFLALLLFTSSTIAVAKPLNIVTSIKPVHSLVTGITQGVTKPKLLMSSNQSPHHYSLRPSERRMLAKADLIFWIGPGMESMMPRLLDSLKNKNRAVSLIQTPGLNLMPIRQLDDGHGEHSHDHGHTKLDAHFWLNTHNADILIDAISQQLIQLDPEHKQQYQSNSQRLHGQVAELRNNLQQSLSAVKKTFLTYHDGYQYFENEFNLQNAGFIASSEFQPGARRISELKKIIQEKNIECIFYDAPNMPPILKSLLAENKAKALMLDPVGTSIPPGKKLWFELMNSLARQFINCQQNI